MCKLFGILYLLLFLISITKSNDLKDEPRGIIRISKHHRKVKSPLKESDIIKITNNDDRETNAKTAQKPLTTTKEEENKEFTDDEKIGRSENYLPEHEIENNDQTEEDILKTVFVGSLSRRFNTDSNDDQDDDKEYSKKEENDDNLDNIETDIENDDESGEILVYTPSRRTLSQDVVLDLKARTGNDQSKEDDMSTDVASSEIKSRTGLFSDFHINMRSGYVPPDYVKDISKPRDYQTLDVNPYNWPNTAYGSDPIPPYYHPNSNQGTVHAHLPDFLSLFSPLYSNSINNKEWSHPNSYGPSSWEAGSSSGQFRNTMTPYFGENYPNSDPKILHRCSACQARVHPSSGHSFRRSIDGGPKTYQTANGRTIEFEPIGTNSYPLVPYVDTGSENVEATQNGSINFIGASPHDTVAPQGIVPGTHLFQDNQPTANERRQRNQAIHPLANVVKPHYRSFPIFLNRRIARPPIGLQRFYGINK